MARSSALGRATQVTSLKRDRAKAGEIRRFAAEQSRLALRLPDGREIDLPDAFVKILLASADELSAGHSVTILASEALLTPQEAAELLGLSRPFVVRLLDAGDLPSENLPDSNHRVIRLEDVLEFQARRERRRSGRRQIAETVESEGLPY